jgi:hypothetical protein
MANSNRVFVSPGIYTSEKDLTFVAQSVGVSTLGLVGETLKGPAFEPILITSFDEFRSFFGPTSPLKDSNNNPKYELPYFAKSYLEESNQLFVTRVLGLTGFKPVKTFGIKTIGGIILGDSVGQDDTYTMTMTQTGMTFNFYHDELSGKTAYDGSSITNHILTNFSGGTFGQDDWFVIGKVPESSTSGLSGNEFVSPLTGLLNSDNYNDKEWFNIFVNNTNDEVYSYLFVYKTESNLTPGINVFEVTRFTYNASLDVDNHDRVVLSFRSRGSYSGQTLNLEVTQNSNFSISGSDIQTNPLSEFTVNVTGSTSGAKTFTCSLNMNSPKYVTKVFGTEVYDKLRSDVPIFVHESYPNYLNDAFKLGKVRGLSLTEVYEDDGNSFLTQWDTPTSPVVVSEVRGGEIDELFEIVTITDGESGNFEVKVSILNINIETGEFDLIVRDFNDTDDNQIVLEKFSRCSMNSDLPGYVARKIGTSDGEYELRSKYIMLSMSDNHPSDAYPAGFKGFNSNSSFGSSNTLGSVSYKTRFNIAGDIIGREINGAPIISSGDRVRRTYFGLSSQTNQVTYDRDLFKFKGTSSVGSTQGFHLSVNASTVTGTQFDTTPYDLEGQTGLNNVLTNINNRKFTLAVCGGFDGWDIYRNVRTYGDAFIFGKSTYTNGSTTNGGVFNSTFGNSDYYSYQRGIDTFSNPEAVDINIFATPGINFFDHSSLTEYAIEMVEENRADSLYVISSPNFTTADEVIDSLDNVSIDSNYSATYWPWIQVRDADNATQLYIPPTGEVLRNIALTDNVSFPWFAVAGYSRGLVNSIKAYKKLTLDERDDLYKNRINPIATFADTGTIIWGNRTLQVRESALDRINVRRLLLRARKLISAVAVRLLFEQNDEEVRNEFLRLVNPILEAIKRERGLFEFRVTVSNDPEDIDSNTLRGKIYIKPTRSLEFIDVEFIITPTGASFDNI